jgi:hypothetical protein
MSKASMGKKKRKEGKGNTVSEESVESKESTISEESMGGKGVNECKGAYSEYGELE